MHTKHRPITSNHLNNHICCLNPPTTPHFYRQVLAFWKGSFAVPDREFQAQEGHYIVGVSIRDGKPTGIIEAPMEGIVCGKKCFGCLGDKICVRSSNKYNTTANNT